MDAEGCFLCLVRKNPTHLIGHQVTLSFILTQHMRDLELMNKIRDYLGFGIISKTSLSPCGRLGILKLTVTKIAEINTLITLFKDSGLIGSKILNFEDFVKILPRRGPPWVGYGEEIVNKGLHKTLEGLEAILLIKQGMNKNRENES